MRDGGIGHVLAVQQEFDALEGCVDFFSEGQGDGDYFGCAQGDGVEETTLYGDMQGLFEEEHIGGKLDFEMKASFLCGIFVFYDDDFFLAGFPRGDGQDKIDVTLQFQGR